MLMLVLEIFVGLFALLTALHLGDWVTRPKGQRRSAALKVWIDKQEKPRTVIYGKVPIRLAHQRESD
jgi:hypothetical protein